MAEDLNVGAKIKDLREFNDYSTQYMAQKLGIAEEEYIELENGDKDISIGIFYNIAAILDIDPSVLLNGEYSTKRNMQVVYSGQGLKIQRYEGYSFQSLAYKFEGRRMEPMLVTLEPNVKPLPVTHNGQEFNYVVKGSLRVVIGEKEFYLREGDSIYFDPKQPHAQIAMKEQAQFITVILDE